MIHDVFLLTGSIYGITTAILALTSILARTPSRRREARATLQILLLHRRTDRRPVARGCRMSLISSNASSKRP
jgi:hypothetical protein